MLTGSSATVTLAQPILFPTPIQIQGFAPDDVTSMDPATILEHMMGVDGVLSFGFVWAARLQRIMLMGDSPSNDFFDRVNLYQQAGQTAYPLSGTVIIPAISRMFTLVNGGLENYNPMPAVRRLVQPREYRIVWNQVIPAPVQ